MEKPTLELIAEINALQRMRTDELRAKYGELIPDMAECRKCEVLRTEIAYRLQERYYGISLPPQTQARLRISPQSIRRIRIDRSRVRGSFGIGKASVTR